MEAFKRHTGIVVPLDRVNVDTDAIIPKQFLKRIERSGFGEFLFFEWRFDERGEVIRDFELNKDRYKGCSILLARANFGCGSSREHAPWAIADYGFKIIIAPSFGDIFYNNCFKNGILPIKLSEDEVELIFNRVWENIGYKLTVDIENKIITTDDGLKIAFEIEDFQLRYIMEGLDDIGLILKHEDKILKYEKLYSKIKS